MYNSKNMENLEEKIARVVKEDVEIVPYNPFWIEMFREEKENLFRILPEGLIRRVEHFGSTAVLGLPAKPVVDILVEVRSLKEARRKAAPILEGMGSEYFWRPAFDDGRPPFYAWFIKRDAAGRRTHHIHMLKRVQNSGKGSFSGTIL